MFLTCDVKPGKCHSSQFHKLLQIDGVTNFLTEIIVKLKRFLFNENLKSKA